MRKALIVGIDYYDDIGCLSGCVSDAYSAKFSVPSALRSSALLTE